MAISGIERKLADFAQLSTSANDAFSFWKLPAAWCESLRAVNAESRNEIEHFLFERYLAEADRRPPSNMDAYYRIKHLIPGAMRHRLNSFAVRSRRPLVFPHWPCEDALLEYGRSWLNSALRMMGVERAWHIDFWPHGRRCCVVLTHDVESEIGLARMEAIADVEERHGFRSAWNLPLAQYPIDWNKIEALARRGFEFGAHGLRHDGRLFRSFDDFLRLKPIVERIARDHGLRGFRAPSTLRNAEWIATMDFDFDSSFADTDPYEPQPGGTCSIFPFFLSRVVELPYTLPQDHTLIHLLRRNPLPIWVAKANWIASVSGMILTLTHPDYCGSETYLGEYEALLKHLATLDSAWRAAPSQVADWWRRRQAMTLVVDHGRPVIMGTNVDASASLLSVGGSDQ